MIGRHTATLFKGACVVAGMVTMLAGATAVAATSTIDTQGNKQGGKAAKDKDKNKDKDNKAKAKAKNGRDHDTTVVVVDRDGHYRVVREYVTRGNLPPGLAKRRTLPPGLSKQLREKGTLPPGLRDYYTPVPADWNPRFPAIPTYYQRYFVGSHLIIIDTRDNTLVSLIRDLLD